VEVSCPVAIVNYDPRWPLIYEEEKHCILGVGGSRILDVARIGSTAVVGLGAKPIVDIMVGVKCSSDADELLPLLREIGYKDAIRQLGHSEWYYCLRQVVHGEEPWLQDFHLHLMKFRSETWERQLKSLAHLKCVWRNSLVSNAKVGIKSVLEWRYYPQNKS
jgi:GrpB-like predicted nucleotidyltransferase (UPF0157 family)